MNPDMAALSRQSIKTMRVPIPTIEQKIDTAIVRIKPFNSQEINVMPAIIKLTIEPYRNAKEYFSLSI